MSKTVMRTGRKISVRNCPNESTTQKYTVLSNPKAVMVHKNKNVKPSYKDGVSTQIFDEYIKDSSTIAG